MRRPLPQTFKGLKDKSNKNDKTKIILYRLHNFWSAKSIQEVYRQEFKNIHTSAELCTKPIYRPKILFPLHIKI